MCRMRGGVDKPPKVPKLLDMGLSWLGAFASILIISVLKNWVTSDIHFDFLVASFGYASGQFSLGIARTPVSCPDRHDARCRASAVLVFGAPEGKLSQPRNLIGNNSSF